MSYPNLTDFINSQRAAGKSDAEIRQTLLQTGWQADQIDNFLQPSVQTPTVPLGYSQSNTSSQRQSVPVPPAQAAPMSNTNIAKLEFARTFSLAWNTYKSNFRVLFPLTLLIYLPIDILDYLIQSGVGNGVYGFVWLFVAAFSFAAYKARTTAIPLTIKTVFAGEHINLKLIMGPLLWTWFLGWLLNLLLFFLLIIPGIIYLIYWSLSTFVVLDKGISGKKALNYSKDLVKGHWWQVLGVILLTTLMVVISFTPSLFFPEGLIITLLTSVLSSLLVLYIAHVFMFVYLHLEDVFARHQA